MMIWVLYKFVEFVKNGILGFWSWTLVKVGIFDEYWLYDNLRFVRDLLKFEFFVEIDDCSEI